MHKNWKSFIFLLIFIFIFPLFLQANSEPDSFEEFSQQFNNNEYQPQGEFVEETTPVFAAASSDSIFKWAWDMSSYSDEYDVAKRFVWTEPNGAGEIYLVLTRTRNEGNGDSQGGIVYGAFRPFVLDFKSFSFAFGASYVGAIEYFEESDANDVIDNDGTAVTVLVDDVEGEAAQQAINFSILASFPQANLQLLFDGGYGWSYLRVGFDTRFEQEFFGDLAQLFEDDYRYKQHDEGLYFTFEIRKFFERPYFNYISLLGYWLPNLETTKRESRAEASLAFAGQEIVNNGRVDLPSDLEFLGNVFEAPDPQDGKEFSTNAFGVSALVRVATMHMETVEFLEGQGISLDAVGGIEYSEGELFGDDYHGAGLTAGAQVSLFDVMAISWAYTWHQKNDLEDEWTLAITVGLYGGSNNVRTSAIKNISNPTF